MSNPENADECLARKWLESQGYTNIKRLCLDPPDYVVGPAEEYAVEVRRLNQRVEVAGQYEGEEQSRIALRNTIEEVLEEFGRPTEGQVWIVDCEYDFSKSLPKTKITKGEVRKALQPLSRPCGDDIIEQHLCLPCGICFELAAVKALESTEFKFLLQNVSIGKGIGIAYELINSIQYAVTEKSHKIRKKNKINDYENWWLLLIDHICHVPISILGESELKALRESIQDRDFWSRIVIISSKNVNWSYEFMISAENG